MSFSSHSTDLGQQDSCTEQYAEQPRMFTQELRNVGF